MAKVQPTGFWTFFCNPKVWCIDEFLSRGIEFDDYTITEWQTNWFKKGQMGLVRVGVDNRTLDQLNGKKRLLPGVYAIVEIFGSPRKKGSNNDPFWITPLEHARERLVVDIRYTENLLYHPILIESIKTNPIITDKYLKHGFQSSSMPLERTTFDEIQKMLS